MEIKTTMHEEIKDDFVYTVLEECGVLGTKEYTRRGEKITETLRVRYLQWGNHEPKYDIRWWMSTKDKGETCLKGKGIGLTGEQLLALKELLNAEPEEEEAKRTKKAK